MGRLIDAEKLKAHYSWWKDGTREMTMGEAKDIFDDIVDLQPTVGKHGEWIPVTERLPEENIAVNITWVNHRPVSYYQSIKDFPLTATGVYYHGKWYWWSAVVQDYLAEYGEYEPDKMDVAIEVTHWMPLPEPYRGGGGRRC